MDLRAELRRAKEELAATKSSLEGCRMRSVQEVEAHLHAVETVEAERTAAIQLQDRCNNAVREANLCVSKLQVDLQSAQDESLSAKSRL